MENRVNIIYNIIALQQLLVIEVDAVLFLIATINYYIS